MTQPASCPTTPNESTTIHTAFVVPDTGEIMVETTHHQTLTYRPRLLDDPTHRSPARIRLGDPTVDGADPETDVLTAARRTAAGLVDEWARSRVTTVTVVDA